ncbi:hypothetical protein Syun_003401 [Stephania yunnanensis]|uniref:Uncharacterized protein n=1 Tax=Stephania yunnanensis TaxID=152371 RepID=A0AAP0L366_9MAGN
MREQFYELWSSIAESHRNGNFIASRYVINSSATYEKEIRGQLGVEETKDLVGVVEFELEEILKLLRAQIAPSSSTSVVLDAYERTIYGMIFCDSHVVWLHKVGSRKVVSIKIRGICWEQMLDRTRYENTTCLDLRGRRGKLYDTPNWGNRLCTLPLGARDAVVVTRDDNGGRFDHWPTQPTKRISTAVYKRCP